MPRRFQVTYRYEKVKKFKVFSRIADEVLFITVQFRVFNKNQSIKRAIKAVNDVLVLWKDKSVIYNIDITLDLAEDIANYFSNNDIYDSKQPLTILNVVEVLDESGNGYKIYLERY